MTVKHNRDSHRSNAPGPGLTARRRAGGVSSPFFDVILPSLSNLGVAFALALMSLALLTAQDGDMAKIAEGATTVANLCGVWGANFAHYGREFCGAAVFLILPATVYCIARLTFLRKPGAYSAAKCALGFALLICSASVFLNLTLFALTLSGRSMGFAGLPDSASSTLNSYIGIAGPFLAELFTSVVSGVLGILNKQSNEIVLAIVYVALLIGAMATPYLTVGPLIGQPGGAKDGQDAARRVGALAERDAYAESVADADAAEVVRGAAPLERSIPWSAAAAPGNDVPVADWQNAVERQDAELIAAGGSATPLDASGFACDVAQNGSAGDAPGALPGALGALGYASSAAPSAPEMSRALGEGFAESGFATARLGAGFGPGSGRSAARAGQAGSARAGLGGFGGLDGSAQEDEGRGERLDLADPLMSWDRPRGMAQSKTLDAAEAESLGREFPSAIVNSGNAIYARNNNAQGAGARQGPVFGPDGNGQAEVWAQRKIEAQIERDVAKIEELGFNFVGGARVEHKGRIYLTYSAQLDTAPRSPEAAKAEDVSLRLPGPAALKNATLELNGKLHASCSIKLIVKGDLAKMEFKVPAMDVAIPTVASLCRGDLGRSLRHAPESNARFAVGVDNSNQTCYWDILRTPSLFVHDPNVSLGLGFIFSIATSLLADSDANRIRFACIDTPVRAAKGEPRYPLHSRFSQAPSYLLQEYDGLRDALGLIAWAKRQSIERLKLLKSAGVMSFVQYNEKLSGAADGQGLGLEADGGVLESTYDAARARQGEAFVKKLSRIVLFINNLDYLLDMVARSPELDEQFGGNSAALIKDLIDVNEAAGATGVNVVASADTTHLNRALLQSFKGRATFQTYSGVDSAKVLEMRGAENMVRGELMLNESVSLKTANIKRFMMATTSDNEIWRGVLHARELVDPANVPTRLLPEDLRKALESRKTQPRPTAKDRRFSFAQARNEAAPEKKVRRLTRS